MLNKIKLATTAIALISLSTTTFAASSANLLLRGVVGTINDITITPNGTNNTTLDIINGEVNKNVASATEISNNAAGYKIMMSSTNGGLLKNTSSPTQQTNYTVSYDGGAATAPTTTPAMVKNVTSLATTTVDISTILVNVTAYPTALAGNYEDTLTLSIVAN